jgi:type II secretory pathway pseudopilin PulG
MTARLPRTLRRVGAAIRGRFAAAQREGGFILLESVIAISLITVIMGAVGAEFVTNLAETSHDRLTTTAVQIADSAVDEIRALHPSDLITGRDKTSVQSEYRALSAYPAVSPWLNSTAADRAYDNTVTKGGSTATIPTVGTTQQIAGKTFTTWEYLECTSASTSGSCASNGTVNYVRVIVAVLWPESLCPAGTCSYVTTTEVNLDSDPTFDLNQPLPPAPVASSPGDQTVAINDVVSLQLVAQNGTGVPPFSWSVTAGSLPAGLTLSPAGLISGTVQGPTQSATPVTIKLTDAFVRSSSITFKWTVLPALQFTPVSDQANITTDSVHLTVSASGGSGGYTYSDPTSTLPKGLSLSSGGVITGTPKPPVPHTYPVTLTVTDQSGRTATTSFNWTVTAAPLALSNPTPPISTVTTATSLQMNAAGGDDTYQFSATGLPTGLRIDPVTGLISGTPTATGTFSVTVTVADPTAGITPSSVSRTFSWTVDAMPSVATPATQKNTIGAAVSVQVGSISCPNSPCTFTLANAPTNVAINASGKITGTIANNAQTSTTVKVSITDAVGAVYTTPAFTWTIVAAPTVSGLAARSVEETGTPSVALTYACPYSSCTLTLSGSVPGVGLSATANPTGDKTSATTLPVSGTSGTFYLGGTVQSSAVASGSATKAYTPSITIQSGDGVKSSAYTATWTAQSTPAMSGVNNLSTGRGSTVSQTLSYVCGAPTCTVKVTGAPSGIGLDTNTSGSVSSSLTISSSTAGTLYLRGTTSSSSNARGTYTVTVTITDTNSLSASDSATWTIS